MEFDTHVDVVGDPEQTYRKTLMALPFRIDADTPEEGRQIAEDLAEEIFKIADSTEGVHADLELQECVTAFTSALRSCAREAGAL